MCIITLTSRILENLALAMRSKGHFGATEREGNNDPVSGSVDDDIQSGAVGQIPDNVCVHCFCDPCVTGNPQAWLGNGQKCSNNIPLFICHINF
jgi:hypothetical protein